MRMTSRLLCRHVGRVLVATQYPWAERNAALCQHQIQKNGNQNNIRYFSSKTQFGDAIQEILHSPLGSSRTWTSGWNHIQSILEKCGTRPLNQKADGTPTFELLDRVIRELDRNPGLAGIVAVDDLYALLKSGVYQWRNHYQALPNKNEASIQPSELVQKIRAWCKQCDLRANTPIYTMLLEGAASNTSDAAQGVLFADSLLEWMIQEAQQKYNFAVQPSILSVGIVMKAWAESGRSEACDRMEEWIGRTRSLNDHGWPNLEPNTVIYNIWLHALARAKQRKRAENVLQLMLETQGNIAPDQMSFSSVLLSYSMENSLESMVDVENLLDQMIELYFSGFHAAKPSKHAFATAMSGFARLGEPEAAERLQLRMEQLYKESGDPDWEPDAVIFNNSMLAWSNAGQPDQAHAILMGMLETRMVVPNENSFHAVLSGWRKIGQPEKAEEVLQQMHELFEAGLHESPPTVQTYNIVLDAWSRSGRKDAWRRGLDILRHMDALYEGGDEAVKPNIVTWNTALNCFRNCGQGDFHHAFKFLDNFLQAADIGKVDGQPNSITWNTLLSMCAKNAKDDFRVQQAWELMNVGRFKPGVETYACLFRCYSRYAGVDPSMIQRVEKYVQHMQNDASILPTSEIYHALIDVYIAARRMEKAEGILSDLCRAVSSRDDIFVDWKPFHRVLKGWLRLGKPRRVESLVLLMEELSQKEGFDRTKPNVETYNMLLQAWARSGERQSGERVDLILQNMAARGVTADLKSHNIALNAWATSGDPIAPSKIENLVLRMILRGNPNTLPDDVSYNTWMKAILQDEEGNRKRRIKELVKTMKIQNFTPSAYIVKAMGTMGLQHMI